MNYNFTELLGCLRLPILILDCSSNQTAYSMINAVYANPIALQLLRVKNIAGIDVEHLLPLLNAELNHALDYSLKTCNIAESINGSSYTLCVSPLATEQLYIVEFYQDDINLSSFTQSNTDSGDLVQALKHEIIKKIIREAGLLKENEYLKRLLNDLPVIVGIKDAQLRYRYVNQRFCDFVYKTSKEVLGKIDFDICQAQEAEYFRSIDRRVLETDQCVTTEDVYTDAFEISHHIITTKTPIRDSDGNLNIQFVCTDITELQQLKEQLQTVKAKYEEMSDLACMVIWVLDLKMRITFVSPSIEMFQGYTADEFKLLELNHSMTPESFATALSYGEKFFNMDTNNQFDELKKTYSEVYSYFHKDGSIVKGDCRFAAVIDSNNNIIGYQGITTKITDT